MLQHVVACSVAVCCVVVCCFVVCCVGVRCVVVYCNVLCCCGSSCILLCSSVLCCSVSCSTSGAGRVAPPSFSESGRPTAISFMGNLAGLLLGGTITDDHAEIHCCIYVSPFTYFAVSHKSGVPVVV